MTVTAIIPALNEEKTVGAVVAAFREGGVSDVIVVDDGSHDATADVAAAAGARVIRQQNKGKGIAMQVGAAQTDADLLFFADADLIGFSSAHIRSLVISFESGDVAMSIGLRDKSFLTHVATHVAPVLGGERVISRTLFFEIARMESVALRDFGIETVMNAYCKKNHLIVRFVPMPGVTHVIKEQKYGIFRGFIARVRMVAHIIRAELLMMKK